MKNIIITIVLSIVVSAATFFVLSENTKNDEKSCNKTEKCSKNDPIRRPNPVPPLRLATYFMIRAESAPRSMPAHRKSRT